MANKRVNFVEQTTATTGTGSITLVAKAGFAKASDGLAVGETAEYYIKNGNNREYGIGTMQASEVFDRTTVKSTLVAGVYDAASPAAITLVGTSDFGLAPGAEDLMNKSDTSFEGALWRTGNTILGLDSDTHVVFGSGNTAGATGASSVNSLTSGTGNVNEGSDSLVIGTNNTLDAGGSYSAIIGASCTMSRNGSMVGGVASQAVGGGTKSLAWGFLAQCTGDTSISFGNRTLASGQYSFAQGQASLANFPMSAAMLGAGETRASYDLVLGNVSSFVPSVANNTIRLAAATGDILIDGAVSSPEAGIGECVEWLDGNPNNEDRTGLGVSFSGGKLVIGGDKIRGVISQTCGLISNDVPNSWHGKYLRDNFKRKLWVEYKVLNWVDSWGDAQTTYKLDDTLYSETQNPVNPSGVVTEIIPIGNIEYSTIKVRQVNPLYDAAQAGSYKARSERQEWGVVETDGQPWAKAAEEITGEFVDFNLAGEVVNGTTYPVMDINGDAIKIWFKGN